jgi:thioredoxin 1
MAKVFTNETFESEILNGKGPALVDFYADWCGPCRMVAPIIEELSHDYEGKVTIGKVNVDDTPEIAGKFGIRSIPTIIMFKDGEVMETQIGALPKEHLKQLIDKHI